MTAPRENDDALPGVAVATGYAAPAPGITLEEHFDRVEAEEHLETANAADSETEPSPAAASPQVENPFFVNGSYDEDGTIRMSVSIVSDAENVSDLHPPSIGPKNGAGHNWVLNTSSREGS